MSRLPKVDLTQGEIPRLVKIDGELRPNPQFPHDGVCKSGHHVPPETTRFFAVFGSVLPPQFHGTYCEKCLAVANRMSQLAKVDQADTINPEAELMKLLDSVEGSDGRN